MLHITNGTAAAGQIHIYDPDSKVMEWGDVLHEGPTPAGLSFQKMNRTRALFLSAQGWGEFETILRQLDDREAQLAAENKFILWFEDDLYDQLQILQILNWFGGRKNVQLALVWIPQGARAADLGAFYAARRTVREGMMKAASDGWNAFCAPTPKPLLRFLRNGASAIPHLSKALQRHSQEYPAKKNGLSRTERQLLDALAAGPATPLQVFAASQAMEESPYMGDSTFWLYMQRLSPLLDGFALGQNERKASISPLGQEVRAGRLDWIQHAGIDRWLGGVHLHGATAAWRWDDATRTVVAATN